MVNPLTEISHTQLTNIKWLFTDVDDTLTWQGQFPMETLNALYQLKEVGVKVVAVTGACAGWCDQMSRLWPLDGVIGENGAFWMRATADGLQQESQQPLSQMKSKQHALLAGVRMILQQYPMLELAKDQPYRCCDVAINIGQDHIECSYQIKHDLLKQLLALDIDGEPVQATISSIHLNVWLGKHNKPVSAKRYLQKYTQFDSLECSRYIAREHVAYIGDSLNDEGMFSWLPCSIGVQNIKPLLTQFEHPPRYITQKCGGYGFAEFAQAIVTAKRNSQ